MRNTRFNWDEELAKEFAAFVILNCDARNAKDVIEKFKIHKITQWEQKRKKFILLKDAPDANTGTIFTDDGEDSGYTYVDKFGREDSWCWKEVVEDNPEWFRQILGSVSV